MSEKENKKSPGESGPPVKEKVSILFKKSKAKPYFYDAFLLFSGFSADTEITENEFNAKLKQFLFQPIK